MALVRARCTECREPLGDPPHVPLPVRCGSCGLMSECLFAADGQPTAFATDFPPMKLLYWFGAARIAMSKGKPGIALGACSRCAAPLLKSSRDPVALPCPHCTTPVTGTTESTLVDQWPEPWTKVEGGGLSLEYRLAIVDDSTGVTAGCAACGLATPSNDPAMRCRRCNATIWANRAPAPNADGTPGKPRRIQLGVRIDGIRGDRPFNVLVPVAQGEQMLRGDAALGASSESGKSLLGITGVGCAIALALVTVATLVTAFILSK